MESIRGEAKRNAELAVDLDQFRSRYLDVTDDGEITVIFPASEIFSFEKNFFLLLSKAEKVKFIPRWHQRPDYTSYDYYNNTIFWPMILFVNRIPSAEDFRDVDYILIPPFESILQVVKDRVTDDPISMEEEEVYSEARYYKIFPLDDREKRIIKAKERLSNVTVGGSYVIDGGVY